MLYKHQGAEVVNDYSTDCHQNSRQGPNSGSRDSLSVTLQGLRPRAVIDNRFWRSLMT